MTILGRNIIEDQLERYHKIKLAEEEVNAIANSIFNEYLDDDIHEVEQYVKELNEKLGINAETIVKALNLLVKQKRLITTNSEKTSKTYIRKVVLA